MASYQENMFADIADAIREKEKSTANIPAVDFAKRIRALSAGGGSGKTSTLTFTHNLPSFWVKNAYLACSQNGNPISDSVLSNDNRNKSVAVDVGSMGLFIEGGNGDIYDIKFQCSDATEEYVKISNGVGVRYDNDIGFKFVSIYLKKEIPAGKNVTITLVR